MSFKKGWLKGASGHPAQGDKGYPRKGSGGNRGGTGPQRVLGLASLRWGVSSGSVELCPSTFFADLWFRPVGNGVSGGDQGAGSGPLVGRWSLFTSQGVDPCSGQMVPVRQHQYWVESLGLPLPSKSGDGLYHLALLRLSLGYFVLLSRVLLGDSEQLLDQFLSQLDQDPLLNQYVTRGSEGTAVYQEYLERVFESGYFHVLAGEGDGAPLVGQDGGVATSVFAYTVQFADERSVVDQATCDDVVDAFAQRVGHGFPVLLALSGTHWPKTLWFWFTRWFNRYLLDTYKLGVDQVDPHQVLSEFPETVSELVSWARECDNVPYYLVSFAACATQLVTRVLGQVDSVVRGKLVMVQEETNPNGSTDRRLYFIVNGVSGKGGGGGFKGRGGKVRRTGTTGVWGKRVVQEKDTPKDTHKKKGGFQVWKRSAPVNKRESDPLF